MKNSSYVCNVNKKQQFRTAADGINTGTMVMKKTSVSREEFVKVVADIYAFNKTFGTENNGFNEHVILGRLLFGNDITDDISAELSKRGL